MSQRVALDSGGNSSPIKRRLEGAIPSLYALAAFQLFLRVRARFLNDLHHRAEPLTFTNYSKSATVTPKVSRNSACGGLGGVGESSLKDPLSAMDPSPGIDHLRGGGDFGLPRQTQT